MGSMTGSLGSATRQSPLLSKKLGVEATDDYNNTIMAGVRDAV